MRKRIFIGLIIMFILVGVAPFLLAINDSVEYGTLPFTNSAFTVVNDVNIHYRVWMPEEPVIGKILFVHGLAGSTFSWRYTVDTMREAGYAVVTVDLPGFGYSDRTRGLDHSQTARARYLWALLEELDQNTMLDTVRNQPWDLVGHSMGGGTITAMVLAKPHRTRALFYVAGSIDHQPPGIASSILGLPVIGSWLANVFRFLFLNPNRINRFLESAYGRELLEYEVIGYLTPLKIKGTQHTFIDITTSRGVALEHSLSTITTPAFLLWGADDSWVPLNVGHQLADDLLHAELTIIQGSAHCPMETHASEFNTWLMESLNLRQ